MRQDLLADGLSAIKNAERAGQNTCEIEPASKMIKNVLKVMQANGYIGTFELVDNNRGGKFKVQIEDLNDCNAIKPRFYVKNNDYTRWEKRFLPARNMGLLIITTSQGVMSHQQAKEEGIGGKLLAYVY